MMRYGGFKGPEKEDYRQQYRDGIDWGPPKLPPYLDPCPDGIMMPVYLIYPGGKIVRDSRCVKFSELW